MKFGLSNRIIQTLIDCIQQYPDVTEVKIYGSRGRGDYRPESDIDLAVFGEKLDSTTFAKLCWDIESLPVIFPIDIVHFESLKNTDLKANIQQDGKHLTQ